MAVYIIIYLAYYFMIMLYDDEIYDELKVDFKNDKKKNKVSLRVYIILLILLSIPFCVFFLTRKSYSFVSSFDDLPAPVHDSFSWFAALSELWKNVVVEFLASYDINWNVISVEKLHSFDGLSTKIAPKNFVIWRWVLWIQENIDKFERFEDDVDPIIYPKLKNWNSNWYNEVLWWIELTDNYFNYRFIPSNNKVNISLGRINVWDRVWIKWYLAHVYLDDDSWSWWPSCTNFGDHWCEIIYVTEVTWLKEE